MESITEIKAARALPEKSPFAQTEQLQPDGTILITPYFRELVAVDLEENTILCFLDADGRLMTIDYDSEGAYKHVL